MHSCCDIFGNWTETFYFRFFNSRSSYCDFVVVWTARTQKKRVTLFLKEYSYFHEQLSYPYAMHGACTYASVRKCRHLLDIYGKNFANHTDVFWKSFIRGRMWHTKQRRSYDVFIKYFMSVSLSSNLRIKSWPYHHFWVRAIYMPSSDISGCAQMCN